MAVPKKIKQILPLLLPALLSGAAGERPNILWITAEDMSPSLGCYGDNYATTPHIDKLAKESVRYTHAFATNPICSPSRSCLITGVYSTTLGTQHLRSDFPIPDFIKGWPAFLREAGYHTANNVKTDYNTGSSKRLISESWTENSATAHWRHRKDKDQPFFARSCMSGGKARSQARASKEIPHVEASKVTLPPYYPRHPEVLEDWAAYLDTFSLMDKQVGQIVDRLKKEGEFEKYNPKNNLI